MLIYYLESLRQDRLSDGYMARRIAATNLLYYHSGTPLILQENEYILLSNRSKQRAPSSTKNAEKKRDPEMHQTKKGNEWRFGMKCHVGVDAGTGLVHTIEVTPANTHDITVASKLIRSDDEVVYGDSGFVGIQKRPEIKENEHLASIDYRIVRRPGSLPKVSDNAIDWERFIDHRKASIRCKVEHVFRIVKRQFGYAKTAYRGLQKNANRLYALFLSSNLYMLARAGRSLQKLEIA